MAEGLTHTGKQLMRAPGGPPHSIRLGQRDSQHDLNTGSDSDTADTVIIAHEDHTPCQATHKPHPPWKQGSSLDVFEIADRRSALNEYDEQDARGRARRQIKKQAWTPAEDQRLIDLVSVHGPSSWSEIAKSLEGRVGKQCRERWHNHLAPEVRKDVFTEEEDRTILEAVAQHGTKWSLIVKLIPGRTDNAIKNRWNSAARKALRTPRCDSNATGTPSDVAGLSASELARHLLAVDPTASTMPRAKRKLSIDAEGSGARSVCQKAAGKPMGGLDLLCQLTNGTASPGAAEGGRSAACQTVHAAAATMLFLTRGAAPAQSDLRKETLGDAQALLSLSTRSM